MAGCYIAQHYGWRWVFIAAGIPGILIAIVLLLTVREPVRGGMDDDAKTDSKTNKEGAEDQLGFIQRLKLVFSEPSLVHCIAGLILVAIASRSEEHTSELQSLMRISYAVFCLKKKNYQSTSIP